MAPLLFAAAAAAAAAAAFAAASLSIYSCFSFRYSEKTNLVFNILPMRVPKFEPV